MIAGRADTGWWAYLSSFVLHGAAVALIALGWFQVRPPLPLPQQLAIEATVVTDLPAPVAATTAPEPVQPEPAPEPAPPQPDPAELQRQAEEKLAEQQKALEAQQAEAAEAHRKLEADRRLEAQKKAAADKKAADQKKAEDEKKAQLARQKADDEKKKQAELQKQAEKQAIEREQADLRARMAAEERVTTARSGAQAAQYKALIRARIERAWIRPPTARVGVDCEVRVTQVPGGAVTAVKIGQCNGDAAVRESIEAAVYRASPLPVPENPDLFERNLVFNFRPNE